MAQPAVRAMARQQPVVPDACAGDGMEGKRRAHKVYRSTGKLTMQRVGPVRL